MFLFGVDNNNNNNNKRQKEGMDQPQTCVEIDVHSKNAAMIIYTECFNLTELIQRNQAIYYRSYDLPQGTSSPSLAVPATPIPVVVVLVGLVRLSSLVVSCQALVPWLSKCRPIIIIIIKKQSTSK